MLKGPLFNLVVNTAAAVGLSKVVQSEDQAQDVALIVTIDTVFRIVLSHAITYFKMTPGEPKTVGNLIFLCSTLVTQSLSVKIAQKCFNVKAPTYLSTMAYIFFGWKANLMVKGLVLSNFMSK